MSPGEWKNGGAGLTLRYGFHPSPFGTAIVIATDRGLSGLAFADPGEEKASLADMTRRWPNATYIEDHEGTAPLAQRIFDTKLWRPDQPLRVVMIGTDFEVRVWETLLKIPMGRAVSYSDIACNIDNPKASRAVGAAVGKTPSPSSCRVTAPSARAAHSPAITGASPASRRCWAGRPGSWGCSDRRARDARCLPLAASTGHDRSGMTGKTTCDGRSRSR